MKTTNGLVALLWVLWWLAPLQASAQTTVKYVHTDALGSVVALTDASGAVVEGRREYEPYGYQTTPAIQDGPGYTGHVQDAATGLTYMQQRYYDSQLGVFLSVDPVAAYSNSISQFHRYRYANNNPYRFTDPDGRIGYEVNQGSNIIIPVYFHGSGATPELIDQIVNRANKLVVQGINISVVKVDYLVGGVNVMHLAPHSNNPNTQFGEGVVAVPGFEHLGPMAAHINSSREDVIGAAVHDILHFVYLQDGYIENPSSTFGNRGPSVGPRPGYGPDQIMYDTGGNEVRSHEVENLRSPNNGMRSGVEWRRVEGRLDSKRQEERRRQEESKR